MGSPQADDINREIVRAWRDAEYAKSLPSETVQAMPAPPADIGSMTDDELMDVLRSGAIQELDEKQLAMAAGANSSNGHYYNDVVAANQAAGWSDNQAEVAAIAATRSRFGQFNGPAPYGPY